MSTTITRIVGFSAIGAVLLFFHQVMPPYEFWPLVVLLLVVGSLVYGAISLGRLARGLQHGAGRGAQSGADRDAPLAHRAPPSAPHSSSGEEGDAHRQAHRPPPPTR